MTSKPVFTPPAGQMADLIEIHLKAGTSKVVGVDEANVVWMWSWHDGRWYAYVDPNKAAALGFEPDPGKKRAEEIALAREQPSLEPGNIHDYKPGQRRRIMS